MDTFKRIRSGITELKREKEELKAKHDVLANELTKVVESNRLGIREVSQRAISASESLAKLSERMKELEGGIGDAERRLAAGISALEKRSEDHKTALLEVGERIQRAQGAAEDAQHGVKESKDDDKALTRYLDGLEKRIASLSSVREKVSEIEKAGQVLLKGVQDLESLSGSVAVLKERLSGLESSIGDKAAQAQSKLSADMASMQKDMRGNSLAIKAVDAALDRSALDLQALRKDLESQGASIARVRGHAAQDRKRLELLGTLQSRIKNLEAVKESLVRGVESNKEMKAKLALLEQKTRDIDARLTGADKVLDSKLQERLKFLEASLTEKGRTMETRLVERGKQFEAGVSADLVGMGKSLAQEHAGIAKLKAELHKLSAGMRDIRNSSTGSKAGIQDVKAGLASISKRVGSLEALRERVKVIEDAKDALLAGMGDVSEVREGLVKLDEKHKSLDGRLAGEAAAIKADLAKTAAGLRAGQLEFGKKVASLGTLRQKIRDIEKLERSLSASLSEIKPVLRQTAALRNELQSAMKESKSADMAIQDKIESASTVLDGKLDYNVAALKRETGFNTASLSKLSEELKALNLEMQSARKDWQAGKRDMSFVHAELSKYDRKLEDIEKLQIRLKEIDQAKDAQSAAVDERIEEKVQFLEASMRQLRENIEAGFGEKTKAIESKMRSDMAGLRKEMTASSKGMERMKTRLESLGRLEERLRFIDEEKDEIERSVASLQAMKANQAGIDERARNLGKEMKEMRSGLAKGLADARSQVDSLKMGGRDKFDSAVKAFLTTRGELSGKMNGLDAKLSELERRMNDFSRSMMRMDLLEKKMDRVTERSAEIRRDVDKLETKGEAGEKVMLVDLEPDKE
ncbi:MAG: hypothetical protein JXC85_03855 [Candidatus Aenigmarchaeota archaeon]|nr:hypothetical protein [Candidatus Aenigmarchaeota archaeon]